MGITMTFEEVKCFLREHYYTKTGMGISSILICLLSRYLLKYFDLTNGWLICLIVILILGTYLSILYCYVIRIPKVNNNKKGIYFCFNVESQFKQNQIYNDFINLIEKKIEEYQLHHLLQVIQLNKYQSNKIKNIIRQHDEAKMRDEQNCKEITKFKKMINRTGGIYFVYGDIIKRNDDGEKYFINIDKAIVTHNPIPQDVSNEIGVEFNNALIKQFNFSEKDEVKAMEVISNTNIVLATYIIGISALISNEYDKAYNIHTALMNQLNISNLDNKTYTSIKKGILNILIYEIFHLIKISMNAHEWKKAQLLNQQVIEYKQYLHTFYRQRVIIEYHIGDIDKSFEFNSLVISNDKTNESKYNKAFLLCHKQRFNEAFQIYKILNNKPLEEDIEFLNLAIENNSNILKQDPSKWYLNFILGFMYYDKLNNASQGLIFYENFIESIPKNLNGQIIEMKNHAKKIIKKIKNIIQIS